MAPTATSQERNYDSELIFGVFSAMDSIAEAGKGIKRDIPIQNSDTTWDYITVVFDLSSQKNEEEEIKNIVKTFYNAPQTQVSPEDVLGFLTNAYSEHDFHESGNWTKESVQNTAYIPYKGILPDYSLTDFCFPISGKLTSAFGYRPQQHRNHNGIDVAAHMGDTVKCALPGVVTKIGYEKAGYGHYIVVAHSGDLETIYAHLKSTIAVPGQKVKAGEVIGLAGATGNSTGPHLHFETRYRGFPVNPYSWFNLSGVW